MDKFIKRIQKYQNNQERSVTILGWLTKYGVLGLRGELGYENLVSTNLVHKYALSLHAPSELIVIVSKPINCYGTLYKNNGNSANFQIRDICGKVLEDLGKTSTRTRSVKLLPGREYILRTDVDNMDFKRTLWVFDKCTFISNINLNDMRKNLYATCRSVDRGNEHNHVMFVLTQLEKIQLAIDCIATHLLNACVIPHRIIIASTDVLPELSNFLPNWIEKWDHSELKNQLAISGFSSLIELLFNHRVLFLKYIIPRIINKRVLVCDNDVIWCGPCEEFLKSKHDITYIYDPPNCYGNNSIKYFQKHFQLEENDKHICAGLYLINGTKITNNHMIELIEIGSEFFDEQGAVGMEACIIGTTRLCLGPPKYLSGIFADHSLNDAEVIHMHHNLQHERHNEPGLVRIMRKTLRRKTLGG